MPRIDTVQTEGAWPLEARVRRRRAARTSEQALRYAAHHRSEFMWPWERSRASIAHGILDDETYDWLAVVEGMLATGGTPARRRRGHARARERARAARRPESTSTHGLRRPRRPARAARGGRRRGRRARRRAVHRSRRTAPHRRRGTTMRSFLGRDILSLKDFERADFQRDLRGLRRARADRRRPGGTPTCCPARRC